MNGVLTPTNESTRLLTPTNESTRLLFADSKNRDVALYPTGESYVLHLTTPIKNVSRVDLVSARVPLFLSNYKSDDHASVIC